MRNSLVKEKSTLSLKDHNIYEVPCTIVNLSKFFINEGTGRVAGAQGHLRVQRA